MWRFNFTNVLKTQYLQNLFNTKYKCYTVSLFCVSGCGTCTVHVGFISDPYFSTFMFFIVSYQLPCLVLPLPFLLHSQAYMYCNGHYIIYLINSFTNEVTFEPIIISDVDSFYLIKFWLNTYTGNSLKLISVMYQFLSVVMHSLSLFLSGALKLLHLYLYWEEELYAIVCSSLPHTLTCTYSLSLFFSLFFSLPPSLSLSLSLSLPYV